jgi:hypothetical protein
MQKRQCSPAAGTLLLCSCRLFERSSLGLTPRRPSMAQHFYADGLRSIFIWARLSYLTSCLHMMPLRHHVQTINWTRNRPCCLDKMRMMQRLPLLTELSLAFDGDALLEAARTMTAGGSAGMGAAAVRSLAASRASTSSLARARTTVTQPWRSFLNILSFQPQLARIVVDLDEEFADESNPSPLQRLPLLTDLSLGCFCHGPCFSENPRSNEPAAGTQREQWQTVERRIA